MKRKKTKKDNNITRNFTDEDFSLLEKVITDARFNFSKEDLDIIKNPNLPASSKSHARAEVALKKIRRMQKAAIKNYHKKKREVELKGKSPITKETALSTFMKISEGQELASMVRVLVDLLVKNKIVTEKGFEKLFQERILEMKHPDPCPQCTNFVDNKCATLFDAGLFPTLAKVRFPSLTGKLAKRVIACHSFKYKEKNKMGKKEVSK